MSSGESPMLEQYRRIKREHQNSVLFFRLGDFYEMFAEDALEVSSLLNLTLTSRNSLPMCGVPYHARENYIARLLAHGKKVAICEQVSEPGRTKLIERRVVEVITPGTTVDENFLEKGSANYLASLASAGDLLSFAYIDLSTGDFYATSFPAGRGAFYLGLELERLEIREIIIAESLLEAIPGLASRVEGKANLVVNRWADWLFDRGKSNDRLCAQFGTANLKAFGLEKSSPEIIAAGALLDYLDDTAKSLIPHVRSLGVYGESDFTAIDEATQCNLELVRNLRDGTEHNSLFEVMNETKTAMGKRLLRRRLLHPLKDLARIKRRLDMVETLYRDQDELGSLRALLAKTPDLERLASRLAMDKAHAKDLVSIMNALEYLEEFRQTVLEKAGKLFESPDAVSFCGNDFDALKKLRLLLKNGLCDSPSILLSEGNLIRDGYSEELDKLKQFKNHGRTMLEEYLEEERENSNIPNLKIHYNRLIGYYLEVSNVNLAKVPAYFIRRQGLSTGERFSTERLAELESEINGASDKIIELEKQLFLEIRGCVKTELYRLGAAAKLIAELDAAQSLAWAATIRGWVRPVPDNEIRTFITEGRHPVVEANLPGSEFIPNDLNLEGKGFFFALITGPNMAGKSTYLRQAALITIMAQTGSFVPAAEARIGLTDRIYCRVGASDNLARGESTFLVEMNETAHILHTATERSLVIMDEVGRGTGTLDGLAIAWAVSEDLLDRVKCRTLFATHFHELSCLEHKGLVNRSMEVLERDGKIVFLRKLKDGPSAESYGLYAASLAGLPAKVLERAGDILDLIREKDSAMLGNAADLAADINAETAARDMETSAGIRSAEQPRDGLISRTETRLIEELRSLDSDAITPLEALTLLSRWKKELGSEAALSLRKKNRAKPGAQEAKKYPPEKPERDRALSEPSLFDSY